MGAIDPWVWAIFGPRGMIRSIYVKLQITMLHNKYRNFGSCSFREEDFYMYFPFSHYKTMADDDAPWAGPVWITATQLAGFIKRTTVHCYTQNMKALGLVVSEKIFVCFSPRRPRGGACMDPRGTVGRIYKEDHYTLLHTKYESFGPCGFGEEDIFIFLCFSNCQSMGANDPRAWPFLTPGAWLAEFIKRTTTHCYKTLKLWALWFWRRRFLYVFPMMPPGWGLYGPQGHG